MALENTHHGAAWIQRALRDCRHIYFIGIGGINMSSLAHITKRRGFRVSGSDRTDTPLIRRLRQEGITVHPSHLAEQVEDADAVVYTVAISADNPEYMRAMERGIPCISRADYLGYLMTAYETRVGVSGMHGKSSCTSMIAETMIRGDADPTVLSGAELSLMKGAYRVGGEKFFVFEACEYMDSFLDFAPTVAVVLNIEMDHVDYFKSMEQIRDSYGRYASLTGESGAVVYNADDSEVLLALKDYGGRRITFGLESEEAEYRAVSIRCERGRFSFDLLEGGKPLCRISLGVTGRYQIYNALATAAVCRLCGMSAEQIAEGPSRFGGAARRMERKGSLRGAEVYDDYGHHPTEVAATLTGAKGLCEGEGRLLCVFQPHTYSRTAALFSELTEALRVADRVWIAPIYAARETDTLGVSNLTLAEAVGKRASAPEGLDAIAEELRQTVGPRDVLVVMGAGDVYKLFSLLGLT